MSSTQNPSKWGSREPEKLLSKAACEARGELSAPGARQPRPFRECADSSLERSRDGGSEPAGPVQPRRGHRTDSQHVLRRTLETRGLWPLGGNPETKQSSKPG